MKRRSSPRVTTEGRLPHRWLPDCTAHFGARPRRLGFALDCINTYKEGCSASAARQAVGGSRGAVVKPRTLQGPSTGSHCGWVVCPRRA